MQPCAAEEADGMNIVITVDDNYIRPALIMLESLFEHNKGAHIWLLHSNVCSGNLERLAAHVASFGGEFTDIRVDSDLFAGAPVNKYFTKEMYYRLLIPQLLPEGEERALYLDPDIIIMDSIEEFYSSDFDGKMMIAIPDYLGDSYYPERKINLGLGDEYRYINSGVLLFNMPLMRREFDLADMFSFLQNCGLKLEFPDQDLINVYFKDKLKYAPRKYNFTTEYVSTGDFVKYVFSPKYRRSEQVVIAHYMGKCKPWRPSYYYKYYKIYKSHLKKYLSGAERFKLIFRPFLVAGSVFGAVKRVIFGRKNKEV